VSELSYALGTFTRQGAVGQLASPDLEADREGVRLSVVPEGIIVQASADGHLSLIVTRVDDKTVLEANRDGLTGYEDVEVIVSAASLLANDSLGGMTGSNLRITGLANLRHGTGFVDDNGFVHFRPQANYSGTGAGFDYVVRAQTGQETTATVDVTLQGTNDAPTLGGVQTATRPVYGYRPAIVYATDDSGAREYIGDSPIYAPFATLTWGDGESGYSIEYILDAQPGDPRLVYHHTPTAAESTGTGRVLGTDAEDAPSALTYELVNGPQYGAVTLNRDGSFQYTSWMAPDTPSSRLMRNGEYVAYYNGAIYGSGNLGSGVYPAVDVFQVRITDSQGASSIQSITVPHIGPYIPNLPTGGGKPVAVDLDGDGFEFVNVDDSQVFFDVTGDGWKRRTAWVGADDGLLSFDGNGDGRIDQASEIAFARYQAGAQTDLQGLRAFDTNGDGRLSAADAQWAKFGVWQDANQNGETDAGEFQTFSAMGISAVGLDSDGRFQVINGQTVHGIGAIQKTDGSQLAMADVTLAYRDEARLRAADGTWESVNLSPPRSAGSSVEGTDGDDLLLGENSNTLIQAKAGDDIVFEDAGNDVIDGGDGNDLLYAGADNDLLIGGKGDDTLYAGLGDDTALGGDGHDAILMEGGNDIALGGAGNDFISGGWGNDVLAGEAGDDQLFGEAGRDALFGGEGNDELWGLDDDDRLEGGTGDDVLDGGAGADAMAGGEGNDTYAVDHLGDTVTELDGQGIDTVQTTLDGYALGGSLENLRLLGTAALGGHGNARDNALQGNGGRNALFGEAGNDRLDGGLGEDTLVGGLGDDTYWVEDLGDAVLENEAEGADLVVSNISYVLPAHVEALQLTGHAHLSGQGNHLNKSIGGNDGDNLLDGGVGRDQMAGGFGDDRYWVDNVEDRVVETINAGTDTVVSSVSCSLSDNTERLELTGSGDLTGVGNGLDNILVGNAGNNRLNGDQGADLMRGGRGDDEYWVDDSGDSIIEEANEGVDAVHASVSWTLSAHVEKLVLDGRGDIGGTGNALNNAIAGNDGDNLLDGAAGADSMAGGLGNDTYWIDDAGDTVTEQANAGHDTVISRVDHALTENAEDLVLADSALRGTGNALDNQLTGNSADNLLDGGAGADHMAGGLGNDTYWTDDAGDTVSEQADAGHDTVMSRVDHTLAEHVEDLMLAGSALNGTGNALDNQLTGNSADNWLDGGAGADRMAGGLGDDTYVVDNAADRVIEWASEGADTVISSVSYVLPEHVENLTLIAGDSLSGTGNSADNRMIGSIGDDTLRGEAGDDWLEGGAGNDVLIGGTGDDTLFGGHGQDRYAYGSGDGLDRIVDEGGEDELAFGPGLTLDNVALRIEWSGNTGTARVRALDACGTEQPDQGLDFDVSRLGDGSVVSAIERFRFADGSAVGLSELLIHSTLMAVPPGTRLVVTGRDDDTILAGSGATTIRSGTGNDTVFGGSGNDSIQGEGGNDALYGGSGNDWLDGGCGTDLLMGGDGRDQLMAMEGQGALFGGRQDDVLHSGQGSHFLAGGKGDDAIWIGGGHQVLAFNKGDGRDVVWGDSGASSTLSFGQDLTLDDLDLRRTGSDLVVVAGGGVQVTLKNWYGDGGSRHVERLQFIDQEETDRCGENTVWQVTTYDFKALVQAFDAARLANAKLNHWEAIDGRLTAHISSSDTLALGGALAGQYAIGGDSAIDPALAVTTLESIDFGRQAQRLQTVGSPRTADTLAIA